MTPTPGRAPDERAQSYAPRELIAQVFGEKVLLPLKSADAPLLAQYVAAITPGVAPLRAQHNVPTLGEELAHLLEAIQNYLNDAAPGEITPRDWKALRFAGDAYHEFEILRREAEQVAASAQFERKINFDWYPRPVRVYDLMLHLADHSAHHRGRLAVLMRLCGIEPPQA